MAHVLLDISWDEVAKHALPSPEAIERTAVFPAAPPAAVRPPAAEPAVAVADAGVAPVAGTPTNATVEIRRKSILSNLAPGIGLRPGPLSHDRPDLAPA